MKARQLSVGNKFKTRHTGEAIYTVAKEPEPVGGILLVWTEELPESEGPLGLNMGEDVTLIS